MKEYRERLQGIRYDDIGQLRGLDEEVQEIGHAVVGHRVGERGMRNICEDM